MSAPKVCPFCELDSRVLKSNKTALLFLSNPRKTRGHCLVIPKRHVEKLSELTNKELLNIFELISFTETKIIGKLGDGCDIRQNYRPFIKQGRMKVNHLHFHVIPRSFEDHIYQVSEKHDDELYEDLTKEEIEKISKLLS